VTVEEGDGSVDVVDDASGPGGIVVPLKLAGPGRKAGGRNRPPPKAKEFLEQYGPEALRVIAMAAGLVPDGLGGYFPGLPDPRDRMQLTIWIAGKYLPSNYQPDGVATDSGAVVNLPIRFVKPTG